MLTVTHAALAITSPSRAPLLPDVPTVRELGKPDLEAIIWAGFLAPRGLPDSLRDRIVADLDRLANDPVLRAADAQTGSIPLNDTPESFRQAIASDLARWRQLGRDRGIRLDG